MAQEDKIDFDDELEEDEDTMEDLYLTFSLMDRHYGIDISEVVEIVVLQSITQIPDMPPFVKGIVNLRGKVIPLIDVRERFLMEPKDYSDRTCVIIIEVNQLLIGLIVDAVSEVVKISKEQMEGAPRVGESYTSRFVEKIGKVDKEVKIILNMDRLLNEKETEQVHQVNEKGSGEASKESIKEKEAIVI